jgi:hypothetical protein
MQDQLFLCSGRSTGLLTPSEELHAVPPRLAEPVTHSFSPSPVHAITQLAILIHLGPAVSPPLAARHVDHEIAVLLIIVDLRIQALLALLTILCTRPRREGVDLPLLDESDVRSNPGLVGVDVFQRVLFLVLPFHVFLLVEHGVPPDIEQAVDERGVLDEEGAQVEARTVLWDDEVDGVGVVVACWGGGDRVEEGRFRWMGDFERVVVVDVSVDVWCGEDVKDVRLKRYAGFHYEGVKVEPPEPGSR